MCVSTVITFSVKCVDLTDIKIDYLSVISAGPANTELKLRAGASRARLCALYIRSQAGRLEGSATSWSTRLLHAEGPDYM